MNRRLNRGAGGGAGGAGGAARGREVFLSAHRCPEVDSVSYQTCATRIPPPSSLVPAELGSTEDDYMKLTSTCHSEEEEEQEEGAEEEEEESISDWSEEDLFLHFSPSVILPSEESDPESSFECVDIAMETQVKGQEGEGLKMVPKRQIQLKKKKDEKEQVTLKDAPVKGGGVYREVTANQQHSPTVGRRPDLLLRQHSLPASLHTRSNTCGDDSSKVQKGQFTGASQGVHGGNARQLLQKSFSLDETKTKMASCIITNVLSKKMQVEQQVKTPVVPGSLQQGGQKAPGHVVRDLRSLVKNTCSHSFSTTTSPPPSYLQAVGVKGHDERKNYRGHVAKVAAALSQSKDGKLGDQVTCPVAHHDIKLLNPPNKSQMPRPLAPPLNPWSRSERNQQGGNTGKAETLVQEQQGQHQQPIVCGPGLLPAQAASDITGPAAAPVALLNGPAPCHMILDPRSGRCFYIDTPGQRKLLLDPETGQYVQVFLPAASPAHSTLFPLSHANPAPMLLNPTPIIINPAPTVLSVVRLQPTVAVTPLYAAPCPPHNLQPP